VTLKMRRGLDDSAASEERFFAILDGAFARGIAAVTVHGRTVRQKYVGDSDWAFLARVKRHLGGLTMLGSGDVLGPYAARAMLAATGVDGVSVARGAIGNPFVFRQIADLLAGRVPMHPSVAEQRAALEQHWQVLAATEPAERVAGALRRHGIKYARLHPEPLRARDAWVAARDAAGAAGVLAEWYSPARFPQPARPLLEADEDRLAEELRQSPAAASAG
jgi:tRNA-dihydrouridine synthase B